MAAYFDGFSYGSTYLRYIHLRIFQTIIQIYPFAKVVNIQLTYVVGCPKPNASSYCTIHRLYFWLELGMELSAQNQAWQKQFEKSSKAMKKFLDIQIFFWHSYMFINWIVYLNSHLEYYHIKSPSKYGPKWVIFNTISVQLFYVCTTQKKITNFFFIIQFRFFS